MLGFLPTVVKSREYRSRLQAGGPISEFVGSTTSEPQDMKTRSDQPSVFSITGGRVLALAAALSAAAGTACSQRDAMLGGVF